MIRKIVDYRKLNENILKLLVEKFPHGYDDKDMISFKNAAGDWFECVEVKTEDTIYLVKISKRLETAMSDYESYDDDDDDDDTLNINDDEDEIDSDFDNLEDK